MVLAVILAFTASFAVLLAFSPDAMGATTAQEFAQRRWLGRAGLAAIAIAEGYLFWSHFRATRRPNLHADFLARLFPLGAIVEVGDCHVSGFALQQGLALRVVLLLQNLREGEASADLRFSVALPPLAVTVPPAGLLIARIDLPLEAGKGLDMPIQLYGRSSSTGRRVRFGRRGSLRDAGRRFATTAAMAFGGHIAFSLGGSRTVAGGPQAYLMDANGTINVLVLPYFPQPGESARGTESWEAAELYANDRRSTFDMVLRSVQDALRTTPSPPAQ